MDAIAGLIGRDVPRETAERLQLFTERLTEENQRQNLISTATLERLWDRHILDSAQLVRFEPADGSAWVDIGSGAGLPGIVIALLVSGPVTLVEPRRLRADFLHRMTEELAIARRVSVAPTKVEHVRGEFDVITARAVASLYRLLEISSHLSTSKSLWVLPKGRSAEAELAVARRTWQGVFHVEPSITDADSQIIVATEVRANDSNSRR